MDNYINELTQTALFAGIEPFAIKDFFTCIRISIIKYRKDEFIFEEGAKVHDFGILLSGQARTLKMDEMGRIIIISLLSKGSAIGIMSAASFEQKSPVAVQAQEDSVILMVPYDGLIKRCYRNCPEHDQLLRNYLNLVAEKGLMLHERIDCLLKPSVREKIISFLTRLYREQNKQTVIVPFDRSAMAEYLNVDRSALSRELSRMKREGLIDFQKNVFNIFI